MKKIGLHLSVAYGIERGVAEYGLTLVANVELIFSAGTCRRHRGNNYRSTSITPEYYELTELLTQTHLRALCVNNLEIPLVSSLRTSYDKDLLPPHTMTSKETKELHKVFFSSFFFIYVKCENTSRVCEGESSGLCVKNLRAPHTENLRPPQK